MGCRGPKPKPTSLKRLLGNPGKRTLNENEPIPPDIEVVAPAILRTDARIYWDQLAPLLIAMKVLTCADAIVFARYCNLLARYAQLDAFMMGAKKGATGTTYVIKDEQGKIRSVMELPQSWEYRQIQNQLLAYEREFGLTPSARSRLRVEPGTSGVATPAPKRDQSLREFFAGGGPAPPRNAPAAGA